MNRRKVLAATGTALSVGLGGCSQVSAPWSDSEADSGIAQWLPTPDAVGRDSLGCRYADVATIEGMEALADPFQGYDSQMGPGAPALDHMELDLAAVDSVLSWANFAVLEGIEDTDAAASALQSREYAETDDDSATIYAFSDGNRKMAIGFVDDVAVVAGTIVVAQGPSRERTVTSPIPVPPAEFVRAILDASEDTSARYTDADETVATLVEYVGAGTAGRLSPDERIEETSLDDEEFENQVGSGTRFEVAGEGVDTRVTYVFAPESTVPVDAVETFWEEFDANTWTKGEEVSVSREENVVLVESSIERSRLQLP